MCILLAWVLSHGRVFYLRTDNTQMGHCLGESQNRNNVPSSERQLSPAAVCIVRAVLHSVLVWTSCNNKQATEDLLQLVTLGSLQPHELPLFFWRHLEKDIELLGRALNKNMQEASLVLHLVIQRMGSSTTRMNANRISLGHLLPFSLHLQILRTVLGPADKTEPCGSAPLTSHTYSQLWRFGHQLSPFICLRMYVYTTCNNVVVPYRVWTRN